MSNYKITSPDGQKFVITAPVGATPDQVMQYAKSQYAARQPKPDPTGLAGQYIDPKYLGSSPLGFAGRTGLGAASLLTGPAQLVANAYDTATGKPGPGDWMNKRAAELEALKVAGGHSGFDAAGLLGSVAGGIGAIPSKLVNTFGKRALVGAGYGAATPVVDGGNFWDEKAKQTAAGAALGPILPAVYSGANKLYGVGQRALGGFQPEKRAAFVANELAGTDKNAITNALLAQQSHQLVPGSSPTAFQIAAKATPIGNRAFAGISSVLEKKNPNLMYGVNEAQDQARLKAVQNIAQTPEALKLAEAYRSTITTPMYEQAKKEIVSSDNQLNQLLSRPAMNKAQDLATRLAAQENKIISFGQATPGGLEQRFNDWQIPGDIAATYPKYSIEGLHYMKLALDAMKKDPLVHGIDKTEALLIGKTRSELADWMKNKSPAYEAARSKFAEMSIPINQMQVGQNLLNKLNPAQNNFGGSEPLQPLAYSRGLINPKIVKAATGFPTTLEKTMTPEQLASLRGVADDFGRSRASQRFANEGSPFGTETASNLFPTLPPAGMFSPIYSMARSAVQRVGENESPKVLKALGDLAVNNPRRLGELMQAGNIPATPKQLMTNELLRRAGIVLPTQVAGQLIGGQ